MIRNECFRRDWIEAKRNELGVVDAVLLEKCIHALQLLGMLATTGLDFVFKGGTSMILLLKRIRRLSIDIDIASAIPDAGNLGFFQVLSQNSPFIRVDADDRGDHRLPRRKHFKFYYLSAVSNREDYVMLDVLQEGNLYPVTQRQRLQASFIATDQDVDVVMPTVDALLADKLTAFAPNTVGVKLSDRSNMQVIKQVVDIGELFAQASDLPVIRKTYAAICAAEIGYRGGAVTRMQALDDTIETARMISEIRLKGVKPDTRHPLFDRGLNKLQGHLIGEAFNIDSLKIAAARAACVAALIRNSDTHVSLADMRYDSVHIANLKAVGIQFSKPLNRLLQVNPEAFFYWHKVDTLLRGDA